MIKRFKATDEMTEDDHGDYVRFDDFNEVAEIAATLLHKNTHLADRVVELTVENVGNERAMTAKYRDLKNKLKKISRRRVRK
jgi:hypothetical protein